MVITLIGYRGSGKTTVAGPLASRLGWDWIDADDELERQEGRSIREIFADDGEGYFREVERRIVSELLTRDRLVLAAGGGAILNEDTRNDMRNAGPVVWLRASVDVLFERIYGDQSTAERRPNLTSSGGRDEIEQVLAQREDIYRSCATSVIETDQLETTQIVDQICNTIDGALNQESRS